MSKRSEFLKGKSLNYFKNISPNEFENMLKTGNEWQLRASVTSMASAVNKRLKEFQKRGIQTPATNYIEDRYGARISTSGLSKNELVSMFFELKGFAEAETSTISGWNRVKSRVKEKMAEEGVDISDVDYEDYWNAYDDIMKMNANRIKRGISGASEFDRDMKYKIMEYVKQKMIENPGRDSKSIARSLFRKDKTGKTRLDTIYEEMERDRRAIQDRISASRYL